MIDTTPSTLAYSANPVTYTKGTAITTNIASNTGGHANLVYAVVSGTLPTGLTLNANGTITGTPIALGSFNPVIRVSNTGGSDTEAVHFTVNDTAPTALAYSMNPAMYTEFNAITANNPSNTGGHANLSYTILSSPLPTGLTLNANGTITGTPTATGSYSPVIRVSNSGGFASVALNIIVQNTTQTWVLANKAGKKRFNEFLPSKFFYEGNWKNILGQSLPKEKVLPR